MKFLDRIFSHAYPSIPSIMPSGAINDIMASKRPSIQTSRIFLASGEVCSYIDKAILLEKKVEKIYLRNGASMPGIFKGTRTYLGSSHPKEYENIIQHQAILYVTSKRIILQCSAYGFEKQITQLTAIQPYSNAVELQFGQKTYSILVPDGNIVNIVIHLNR